MDFPDDNEAMMCPHCHARCAFRAPQAQRTAYQYSPSKHQDPCGCTVSVAYCQGCGRPIIALSFVASVADGVREPDVVFPLASVRPLPPDEVRETDSDLAADYDEALAVEPHSRQATAFLLRRCMSHVLIKHCAADKRSTLGPQITAAIAGGKLPKNIVEGIDILKKSGDQAGHPWFDAAGEPIRVDAGIVDWCFGIMDMVFEHFYVAPKRREKHQAKMDQMFAAKKAGDQQQ